MSNNNAIIALIVIVVLAIGGYFLFAHKAVAPVMETTATTTASTDTTTASSTTPASTGNFTVTYTDQGFSPSTFNISVGTTVHFVNNSSRQMWVAVGEHPTHTTYDGTSEQQHCAAGKDTNGSFDECTGVPQGTVYTYTFDKAGTFSFHNHLHASDTGTVTVNQQ